MVHINPCTDEIDATQMQAAVECFYHYLKGKEYRNKLEVIVTYNTGENN